MRHTSRNDGGECFVPQHNVTTRDQLPWYCALMLPTAYSYALTLVSLYASGELASGQLMGPLQSSSLLWKSSYPPPHTLFLFPEDLVTITLTNPDGGQARALAM